MRVKSFARMLLLGGLFIGAAQADEAAIKKNLESRFSGLKVQSVVKTPYSGLYEVFLGGEILYTDDKASYLFVGNVLDAKTQRNLTEERLQKLTAIRFDTLPLDSAIKVVKGKGTRKIAVFSDPDCPYCKKFEQELKAVNDITVYTFLYPIDSLHPEAASKSRAIWCAPDRPKAWDEWMQKGVLPQNKGNCDNPVAKLVEFGQKQNISGTPTIIFADGRRVPGMIPAARLEKMLDAAAGAK